MAYVVTKKRCEGQIYVAEAVGTSVSATDEFEIRGLPYVVTVLAVQSTLVTAGAATSLQFRMGSKTSFVAGSVDELNSATEAEIKNALNDRIVCYLPETKLVIRPAPNGVAGSVVVRVVYSLGVA